MFEPYENLAVRAECPNCKKLVNFDLKDASEKQNFSFRAHDCSKCLKKQLKGWVVKY